MTVLMLWSNKLECLHWATLNSLVWYFVSEALANPFKYALNLLANIRLGWKCMPVANTLAYLSIVSMTTRKYNTVRYSTQVSSSLTSRCYTRPKNSAKPEQDDEKRNIIWPLCFLKLHLRKRRVVAKPHGIAIATAFTLDSLGETNLFELGQLR